MESSPLYLVLAAVGALGILKKLVLLGLPDLRDALEAIFRFAEWFRDRWHRFRKPPA